MKISKLKIFTQFQAILLIYITEKKEFEKRKNNGKEVPSYHWLCLSLELYFSVKSLESGECLWCLNSKQIWSPHVQPYKLLVEPVQRHAHPSCCCHEKKYDNDPVLRGNSEQAGNITLGILHLCNFFLTRIKTHFVLADIHMNFWSKILLSCS